jgi:hypothetical protein
LLGTIIEAERWTLFYTEATENTFIAPASATTCIADIPKCHHLRFGSSEITFIGSSMGTYGALLYSSFLPCDQVVCLGGIACIMPKSNTLANSDRVIDNKIRTLSRFPSFASEYDDMNSILKIANNLRPVKFSCRYFNWFGKGHEADFAAAQYLKGAFFDSILMTYDTRRHSFMPEELKTGVLLDVLS